MRWRALERVRWLRRSAPLAGGVRELEPPRSGGSRRPYTGWSRFYTPRRRECGLEGGVRERDLEGGDVSERDLEGGVWVRGPEGSGVREHGLEDGNVRERGMDCGVLPPRQVAASSGSRCGRRLKCAAWIAASCRNVRQQRRRGVGAGGV
jgi:hypothetical protein